MPNPLNPPLRNDSAATLAKILEAAQAILLEQGPRGLTVRAIAQRTDKTQSTIYRWGGSGLADIEKAICELHFRDLLTIRSEIAPPESSLHRRVFSTKAAVRSITSILLALQTRRARLHFPVIHIAARTESLFLAEWIHSVRKNVDAILSMTKLEEEHAHKASDLVNTIAVDFLLGFAAHYPTVPPRAMSESMERIVSTLLHCWEYADLTSQEPMPPSSAPPSLEPSSSRSHEEAE